MNYKISFKKSGGPTWTIESQKQLSSKPSRELTFEPLLLHWNTPCFSLSSFYNVNVYSCHRTTLLSASCWSTDNSDFIISCHNIESSSRILHIEGSCINICNQEVVKKNVYDATKLNVIILLQSSVNEKILITLIMHSEQLKTNIGRGLCQLHLTDSCDFSAITWLSLHFLQPLLRAPQPGEAPRWFF